ncbi:uncharacterized protein LOC130823288 [Amaranthus tricolor]|uniref:uncharacterized protein LOC130823288 n=1 Tax=Amaranthus tricolor TaxID=29722 RepID=UPI00258DBA21|nr:uncharacterized protein LOC130823288 [Amaranthus tricolor]
MAQQLSNLFKPSGQLPSNTEKNPSGHVNAATLRSDTTYNPPPMVVVENEEGEVVVEEKAPNEGEKEEQLAPAPVKRKQPTINVYVPPVPFPQRLAHRKLEEKYGEFLEVLSKLEINIPFIDAFKKMPSYAKFLKEVLSNKRKLPETGVETLRGECSAILECKVPKKESDLGSFTIPVKFGEVLVNKALADLGASVSIMPLSLCKRINAEIKPTKMSLQLANRLVRFSVRVVEDLPVQIGKFYVPCDFVIMDIVEDHVISIILGKDFLKTTRAVFDVFNGKLTLNILGRTLSFIFHQ